MTVVIPGNVISAAQIADPDLWELLLAIAGPESTWRPDAIGDDGCSIGLVQLNTCGGVGTGYSIAQLMDPITNFSIGAQQIRAGLAAGESLYAALWPWRSTRDAALALYQRIQVEGVVAGEPTGGPHANPLPILGEGTGIGALALLVVAAWLLGAL